MTPFTPEQVTWRPANRVDEQDVELVFGGADARKCRCQRYKVMGWIWRDSTQDEREAAHRAQVASEETSGLIAYVDGEPAGWAAVEPRTAYPKLRGMPVPWRGRDEDRDDHDVWAVTCLVVRKGFRGRGLTYHLAAAAVEYARSNGARALEAYPMETRPGKVITWGELHVGPLQVFQEAGFREVTHPTLRRYVMRLDF